MKISEKINPDYARINLDDVRKDLRNTKCEGFYMGCLGYEITTRRINDWQFDVTTEAYGRTNTDYAISANAVERIVLDWFGLNEEYDDDRLVAVTYIPHYPATKWPSAKVEKFMNSLCPKMCNPLFKGFTLSAEGAKTYVVRKHPNGMEWKVDGKITDFGGVLRMTRAKLAEEHLWEFEAI